LEWVTLYYSVAACILFIKTITGVVGCTFFRCFLGCIMNQHR